MPFIKINYDQAELSRLALPEEKDEHHKFHYRLFKHSDGHAILIDQIYNHHSEWFEKTVLQIEGRRFLVEYKKTWRERHEMSEYTLRKIVLYVRNDEVKPLKKRLKSYLPDVYKLFIQENGKYTKIGWFVRLRIVSENRHSVYKLRDFTNFF